MPEFNYDISGSLLSAGVRDADLRDEVLEEGPWESVPGLRNRLGGGPRLTTPLSFSNS